MAGPHETLHIRPAPSRYLRLWLLLIQAVAWLVLWQLELNIGYKLVLGVGLLAYLAYLIRQQFYRRGAHAIVEAKLQSDGRWLLTLGNGAQKTMALQPDSFIKPWLMILNFSSRSMGGGLHLILLPDSLDRDLARRLRIYLRQGGVEAT